MIITILIYFFLALGIIQFMTCIFETITAINHDSKVILVVSDDSLNNPVFLFGFPYQIYALKNGCNANKANVTYFNSKEELLNSLEEKM